VRGCGASSPHQQNHERQTDAAQHQRTDDDVFVGDRQPAEKKDDAATGGTVEDADVEAGRDRLRVLEDRGNLRQIKIAEIRRSIEESRKDDRTKPADEVLSRLGANKYIGMSDKTEAQGGEWRCRLNLSERCKANSHLSRSREDEFALLPVIVDAASSRVASGECPA
jgi:hypothetical protein